MIMLNNFILNVNKADISDILRNSGNVSCLVNNMKGKSIMLKQITYNSVS